MENLFFDIISWVGLVICIGAFFIKDVFRLRLATLIGCSMLFVYYSHIDILQGVISNLLVLLINAYYIMRFIKAKRAEKALQQTTLVNQTVTALPE
ncbi:YgjV family protein [Rheinheimera sp. MMS21-TC3]|uniref:YgjV family protein n=1 Tax=Rheinheimera sp. MMS21-TC3 TaxID=3072790 RepID=UPI0028C48BFA|nr:YgjV family protein [Rheinheimera sp. MMS21-TC3]WNO59979.1 YgjV family protein [Rheinheimera sp. MMS21-TC3]